MPSPKKKVVAKTNTTKTPTAARRRKAKPALSTERMKLVVENKDPGYEYYWADEPDIQNLQARDYSFVQDPEITVGSDEKGNQSLTSAIKRDGGGGKTLYLMRIRKEWYDEDRAAEEQALKAHEKHIYQPGDGLHAKTIKVRHGQDFDKEN